MGHSSNTISGDDDGDDDDDDDDTNEDGEGGITDKHRNVFSRQVEPELNFCTIPSLVVKKNS